MKILGDRSLQAAFAKPLLTKVSEVLQSNTVTQIDWIAKSASRRILAMTHSKKA
jgi:hypothetical protein